MSDVPAPPTPTPASAIWLPTLVAAVTGTVVNVLLYLIGKAAGVSYAAPDAAGNEAEVVAVDVIVASFAAMLVGAVAAVVALPRWPTARRGLQVAGVLIATGAAIIPWLADLDAGTEVVLTLMHLVLAVAYVLGIEGASGRPEPVVILRRRGRASRRAEPGTR